MFVYRTSPIDDWGGWQKPEDMFRLAISEWSPNRFRDATEWEGAWARAQAGARRLGGEGDCSQGPFVSVIPVPKERGSRFIIAWKQSNDGTTFVASPFALPWIESEFVMV